MVKTKLTKNEEIFIERALELGWIKSREEGIKQAMKDRRLQKKSIKSIEKELGLRF